MDIYPRSGSKGIVVSQQQQQGGQVIDNLINNCDQVLAKINELLDMLNRYAANNGVTSRNKAYWNVTEPNARMQILNTHIQTLNQMATANTQRKAMLTEMKNQVVTQFLPAAQKDYQLLTEFSNKIFAGKNG